MISYSSLCWRAIRILRSHQDVSEGKISWMPYFFQVWLMECLKLVAPLENLEKLNKKGFTMRPKLRGDMTFEEWASVLADRYLRIRWIVLWWGIKHFIGASSDHPYVTIASLDSLTFYLPMRVLRQYGYGQVIPDVDIPRPNVVPLSSSLAKRWERYWIEPPKWH